MQAESADYVFDVHMTLIDGALLHPRHVLAKSADAEANTVRKMHTVWGANLCEPPLSTTRLQTESQPLSCCVALVRLFGPLWGPP